MIKKVCVVTGSRAEYGLLRRVMQGIKDDPSFTLQIIATGMHLSPKFGNTYQDIEHDGFTIDRKVEILMDSDSPADIAKSMGNGMIGFAIALDELEPDLIMVLGDRFEIFSAVAAALVSQIPVAHIHGGELTEGNFDDALRHSITKMSHLHFVAAEEYRNRVVQLGESPDRVFNVGGLGVDNIANIELISQNILERDLPFLFQEKNILVTFHPVTLEPDYGTNQLAELLNALDAFPDMGMIFTLPNADSGGKTLRGMIQKYVLTRKRAACFVSLGSERYLSVMACVDGVVGNSSSGLLEAPSLQRGSVDIGDRQRGRIRAESVIHCDPNKTEIETAITKLLSSDFQVRLKQTVSPFGVGGASEKIVEILKDWRVNNLLQKEFYDYGVDRP